MKKYIKSLFFFLFLLFLTSFVPAPFFEESEIKNIPEPDLIAMEVIEETSKNLEKKYGLRPAGFGMDGKFEYLEITFEINRPLSKKEAREIVLLSTNEFLKIINAKKELKKYLKNHPFDYKNAGIVIHIRGVKNEELFDPNLCLASSTKSGVRFYTNDPKDSFKYKEKIIETHEEALKLLQNQKIKNR